MSLTFVHKLLMLTNGDIIATAGDVLEKMKVERLKSEILSVTRRLSPPPEDSVGGSRIRFSKSGL